MGGQENPMRFQQENESILTSEKPSSETTNNPFLSSSSWDPLVSLSHQSHTFGGSSMISHNEFSNANVNVNSSYPLGLENTSHLVQYMSDSNLVGMIHKVPSYGSGSFSEIVGAFVQHGSGDLANTGYSIPSQQHYNHIKDSGIERAEQSQVDDSIHEDGVIGSATPSGNRRKRGLDQNSTFSPNKVCYQVKYNIYYFLHFKI